MIYQQRKFTCGPASLANAANWIMGKSSPSEDAFKEACYRSKAVDTEGTTEHDLKRALRQHSLPYHSFSLRSDNKAREQLRAEVFYGMPVICYGRKREHWFTVIGTAGYYFVVIDSADEDLVLKWTPEKLLEEWGNGDKKYYGIVVGK